MTKDQIRNKILSLLELRQGLKGKELITILMENDLDATSNELMDIVFDMVEAKEICEIEYILGGMSKSFLVPKGTKINIINWEKVR